MAKDEARDHKVFDVTQLPPLITIKQAAELTGVSTRTISRQCDSGEIYAVKVGRSWRINTAMLLEQMGVSTDGVMKTQAAMAGPISAKLYRDEVVQRQTEKLEPVPRWVCEEAGGLLELLRQVDDGANLGPDAALKFLQIYDGLRLLACAPVQGFAGIGMPRR